MIINVLKRYGELGDFPLLDDNPRRISDKPRGIIAATFSKIHYLCGSNFYLIVDRKQPKDIFTSWEYQRSIIFQNV